jgi:hypothetical protein
MPLLSVDEYLNSSYRPDMEYVDGVLVERGEPTIVHGLFQVILGAHFSTYRKQFRFAVLPSVRTQIVKHAVSRAASHRQSSKHGPVGCR